MNIETGKPLSEKLREILRKNLTSDQKIDLVHECEASLSLINGILSSTLPLNIVEKRKELVISMCRKAFHTATHTFKETRDDIKYLKKASKVD